MDGNHFQRQATLTRRCFFEQGYIDSDQFNQLEELQDEANPSFVEEVVSLFYSDSARLIRNIEQTLLTKPMNFEKLENHMHQFKGSCSSIGAIRVINGCKQFRDYCFAGNVEGCTRSFELVKHEHEVLRKKLDIYFQLVRQAGNGEAA